MLLILFRILSYYISVLFDYENGAVIVVGEILRSFISNMMLDDVVIGSRISEVDVICQMDVA